MYDDPPDLAPLPERRATDRAKSVAKRRNEFITVRYCARQALGELGVPPVPILKGDKGEPCWPDGVVGSLTHCTGYRGAAVGRHGAVRSVGIDAEPHDVLPNGVLDAISLPKERIELQAMPNGLHWDRILFCAKEATYKAWYPLTHRWLGFEDAHITFDVDDSGTSGGVRVTHPHRPGRRIGPTSRVAVRTLVGARRSGADCDRLMTEAGVRRRRQARRRRPAMMWWAAAGAIFGTRKVGHAGTARPDGHRRARQSASNGRPRSSDCSPPPTSRTRRPCGWARRRRPRTPKAKSLQSVSARWPHRCADRCGGRRAAR